MHLKLETQKLAGNIDKMETMKCTDKAPILHHPSSSTTSTVAILYPQLDDNVNISSHNIINNFNLHENNINFTNSSRSICNKLKSSR